MTPKALELDGSSGGGNLKVRQLHMVPPSVLHLDWSVLDQYLMT